MSPTWQEQLERQQTEPRPAEGSPTTPQIEAHGQEQKETDPREWAWIGASPAKLAQALVFGLVFGFLLQKGGVAKFDILIGVLLLEKFVVVQVMLSAIIVGMVGVYLLDRAGLLELQIKETVFGANILGGLIFGVGFGLIAYCPGTDAAAVGQGNLDAIVGILGMMCGSYLFALSSKFTSGTVSTWGQQGKLTLADAVGLSRGTFIAIAVPILVGVLVLIELTTGN
jgi:uncharacterized protein